MQSVRDQLQPAIEQAIRLHQTGRVAEAEQIYRQVLARDPENPDALHLLGLIAHHVGHASLAAELMTRAIASDPGAPVYHLNLAKVFRGAANYESALKSAMRAVELNGAFVEAHVERAACLKALGRLTEAESAARLALRFGPQSPDAHSAVGNALSDQGRLNDAIAEYEIALRLRPQFGEAVNNLGEARRRLGQYDQAERLFRRAIELTPDIGDPHMGLALTLLVRGRFEEGWREYEWRWRQISVQSRRFDRPMWAGEDLSGKTILLYGEQGLGDVIQFIRYAPMVRARGARVIIECESSLVPLIRTVDGVSDVISVGQPLPAFDVQCPVVSLPIRFQTTLATLPNQCPYVRFDPDRAAKWRAQLGLTRDTQNIGLVWAGSAIHKNDHNRSMRLADLRPLLDMSASRFVSLQLGPPAGQLAEVGEARIIDASPFIRDLGDSAALMSELDLIISVDSSPAHLAGALARPVWMLVPFIPDFRWLLDRTDSPWYPTMRLFRQPGAGDWKPVVAQVVEALRNRVAK